MRPVLRYIISPDISEWVIVDFEKNDKILNLFKTISLIDLELFTKHISEYINMFKVGIPNPRWVKRR